MLRKLFGDDVAENDAHLSEYFIETPAYRMALSGEKRFIIGRKGAGKSAICQQLQKQLPQTGALCIPVAPQRIQFTALKLGLRDLARWGRESDILLQRVWYYGLLCETAFALTKWSKKQHDSDYTRIAAFVEKYYNYSEPNAFARLLNTTTLFLQQLELGFGPLSVRRSHRSNHALDAEMELDRLRAPIASFIAKHLSQGVYILIDNLDEGWDNSAEANAFVRGLLLAIYEICQPNIPVRMIVFFRSDMYDAVTREFQQIDKYRQFQEHIYWGRKEIMELVAQRIRVNRQIKRPLSITEVWETVFDAEIGNERVPHYMIERSLLRPREVLQFCRLAAEKAEQRSHDKITPEDISDAENEYSRWKIDDLSNEFLYSYPGIKDKILLRFFGCPSRIAPATLKELLEEALTDPRGGEKHDWAENLHNVEELIQILYNIGFLKARGQSRVWQSAQYPDFNVAFAEEFSVHPAFRRYLRIGHRK
ncbi:MAG: hypothetical protein ONB44_22740 [candidate division KSB1 bacterium]|nr:hypothetical protein [candidate division KSB1 bacterium]MDZ7304956.1 hypothetical protein [candidate division KSB1 bacterium]MDZ7314011.1 hypothetical protein [candidate division KSB1 bacterium]